jgi:hypothetical protein
MTLIVTSITNHGIVQASDSYLTRGGGTRPGGTGTKVFHLGFTDAALSLMGAFSVGGDRMDHWMPDAITTYSASNAPTLAGFAEHLRGRLSTELADYEWDVATLIHIAGYVDDGSVHPEFWFVRNAGNIDPATGEYTDITQEFQISEDFWGGDHLGPMQGGRLYFNGSPDGRINFYEVHNRLEQFFQPVWAQSGFRPPRSLEERAAIVDLEIRAICTMFITSDFDAPPIGGDPQIELVPAPPGAVTL